MKRSERFAMRACQAGMMAGVIFAGSVAAGVWSVRALMELMSWSESVVIACSTVALIGLYLTWLALEECLRCHRMARLEAWWEEKQAIRPRVGASAE